MASVRENQSGNFELCIRHKLLGKDSQGKGRRIYITFPTRDEAEKYGQQCDALLNSGVVPAGLLEGEKIKPRELPSVVILAWMRTGGVAKSDADVLQLLASEVGNLRLDNLTYTWAQGWVRDMKLLANYAPGTIRKRIGALSRCLDDYLRHHPDINIANPLRLLPRGAAAYNAQDAAQMVALDKKPKIDQVRERRLRPGELEAIYAALAGHKRDDRERPLDLKEGAALRMLFELILWSGVRLREAYMLRVSQVRLQARTLHVKSSKQWYGREKYRDVPMRPQLHSALTQYLEQSGRQAEDLLFPWWDGDAENLARVTSKLSTQFGRLFDYAKCDGLTEHDLRHEATCQWYELKTADGSWMFREKEIDKIMGWAPGSAMSARYASFRAEDLAGRLYE